VIDRRAFLAGSAALLAAPLAAEGQQAAKMRRLGYLGVNGPEDVRDFLKALRLGRRDHGWVEGQNIHIEYRWAEGHSNRLAPLADELGALHLDLLLAPTTQAIQACRRATRTIPIVMIAANDPLADGFIASFAHPGGNITGLVFDPGQEIGAKHVEILFQVVPKLSRIAVLGNPANQAHGRMTEAVRVGARRFGLRLVVFEARVPDELKRVLDNVTKARPGAMLILSDGFVFGQHRLISNFAAKHQLPAIYPWSEAAVDGGLMTYGANVAENFRRAASFVDRILKGARPGDLPVELPTKFELVINLETAKALGLTIPQSLLLRADQVVE
jgi:putative ABC transport system substrate-binding protein